MSSFDGLSLTNTRDAIFNRLALVFNNNVTDIFNIFALKGDITLVTGLPPDTLNTLQELAGAINNDPDFFQYIRDQLALKRNTADSYDKTFIDNLIASYYTKTQTDTLLNTKLNSSVINDYYTKTQSNSLYANITSWSNTNITVNSQLNLKANITDLNNYYTKAESDNIIINYYNKNYVNDKFSQYYTSADVDTLLDTNYYEKSYIDMNQAIAITSLSYKADKTELSNFYTQTTTNSLLENYYNRNYIDTSFNKYYTITGVNSLLIGKVDNATLNNYYDKTYINNTLSNYYQKYQVDGLLNNYYTFTTSNNLYSTKDDLNNLSITVNSNLNNLSITVNSNLTDIVNIKNTQLSFLQTNLFNSTIQSYLKVNDFTTASLVNITQLNSLNLTQTSTIQYINNIYNNVNTNSGTITDISGTLNSVITDVSNIKITLPSFLQINPFNTTINSYLKINDFTNSSLLNVNAFSNTLTSSLNNYVLNSTYNNTILTRLNTDSNNIIGLTNTSNSNITLINNLNNTVGSLITNSTLTSNLNNYTPLTTYNNTILTRLNTDSNNIIGLTNTTTSNINLINNLSNTVGSLITSSTINSNLSNYLLTSNFNSTISSYLLTNNFNNTISSYLLTNNFNNTISSYLTTGNFNSTISSYLTLNAFNNTLTSSLSNYATTTTTNSIITNVNNLTTTTNSIINNSNTKSNITNPSFFGTLSINGNTTNVSSIYTNNYYTNISSLRLVNPNIIELCISSPSNILMSLDNANGADFNCLLSCETNFSVLGASELIGNVSCSKILNVSGSSSLNETTVRGIMTCNSLLNVSGSSILRSSLSVSGTSNFNNVVLNNASTAISSFFISGATTLNSTLNVSGATLLRSNLNVSGTATFNNLTINGTLTGATFTNSLVGLSNVANTAPSDLPISTATQSALTSKQNKTTYVLPGSNNGTAEWFLLGTLTTGYNIGNVSTLVIESHYTYEGNPLDEYMAYIHFSPSNGINYTMLGEDNTPFYGEASIISSTNFYANVVIQQNSPTSWSFYYYSGVWSGVGLFTINTNDTFTYSGTAGIPTGCYIYPKVRYTHSIGEISVDKINTTNVSTLNITGVGTLNISGSSVLRSSLSVSGTSNFNNAILNNSSTVLSSLFISGATTLNSTLNISGNTLLRSNLNVSSTATLNNLTVNGTITGANFNKTLVGLSNVANTAPTHLPISTAVQSALNGKLNTIPNAFIQEQSTALTFIHNNAIMMGIGSDPLDAQLLAYMNTTSGINLYHNLNFITAKTVFLTGGGLNINGSDTLNLNAYNGVNLWGNNNTVAYFNSVGITLANNTKILQATTGDNNLIIQNTLTGTSSLGLFSNTNVGSRISQNSNGNLNFSVNVSGTSSMPLSLYSNGVCQIGGNTVGNKALVLYEQGASDTPSTATNFFGLGINTNTLRYQVPSATNTHRFFCGSTQSFTITNGTGANGSDIRYKSEIEDITNALDKVKQLRGKTFVYNGCTGRQMGLIAQEVKPIVPEVVMIDDEGYHLMCYDRLVALLIESVKELEKRINILENKFS
jgi:hypothetical protein